ncbi:MAG: SGNH/GDSL hydrolase family protein [Lactobacillales bacterium]|nr:SGNH/GDSL hydrolase family protein [Lactobacillales bacterium]
MQPKIIAALGDSITQGYIDETGAGWFGRLAARISKNKIYGFHNISAGGDRICDAWHRFASQCMTMDIDVLIIAIGCNDTRRRGAPNAQLDLSPMLCAKYWEWLLDEAQKNIGAVIVLDILPIREETNEEDGGDDYHYNTDIKRYNKQIAKLCGDRGIVFVQRYDKWEGLDLSQYYVDFGHPNGKGHQKIADEIYEALAKLDVL